MIDRQTESTQAPLRVQQISRTFGELLAVRHFSITIKSGELLSLLGPNGAGKTTLIRMLTGILRPDQGEVILDDTSQPGRREISRRIGYCPQRIIVWMDLTCLEQLTFAGELYGLSHRDARSRAMELLEIFNLSPKKNALAKTLSGGMQRRLSVALAMVHKPAILVLDEPEAGLDPQSRVLIRNVLHSLCRSDNTAVVLSTHDMAEAELLSDRVAIMNRGMLLAEGTPEALIAENGSAYLVEMRLTTAVPADIERLTHALGRLGAKMVAKDNTIILDSDASGALVRPVRTIAAAENVAITELRHRKRTLEDVFLSLTAGSMGGVAK
ncbi:MAG: ABC transporter ATP-binding protein [Deltaproteobacteria bacterium]|nr:ABC transporter ATP-binding protein [Deltaproteobacteria bacterium]